MAKWVGDFLLSGVPMKEPTNRAIQVTCKYDKKEWYGFGMPGEGHSCVLIPLDVAKEIGKMAQEWEDQDEK